jgi:hypothetical protein
MAQIGPTHTVHNHCKIYDKTRSLQAQYMDQQIQKIFQLLSSQLQQNMSSSDTVI